MQKVCVSDVLLHHGWAGGGVGVGDDLQKHGWAEVEIVMTRSYLAVMEVRLLGCCPAVTLLWWGGSGDVHCPSS